MNYLSGGGYYPVVGEGILAGMPIYKGYHELTPPIFSGELLNSSLGEVSCAPNVLTQQGSLLKGGRKKRRTRKNKRKSKKSKKNRRKSKKNKRRTKKRTYRK